VTLLGVKARNHPQQVRRLGIDDSIDDRRTPQALFDRLHCQHRFTVDAAASAENAKLPHFWTRAVDGTAMSWAGHRVWCNPPFSRIDPWVSKAWNEMLAACQLACLLLPANRAEQGWWQVYVEPWRDKELRGGVRLTSHFLPGRVRFGRPEGHAVPKKGDRPPFGLVVLTWQREP
jgi:phage N-6-adenine-methyltransferase